MTNLTERAEEAAKCRDLAATANTERTRVLEQAYVTVPLSSSGQRSEFTIPRCDALKSHPTSSLCRHANRC